jgi:hypothetical protein
MSKIPSTPVVLLQAPKSSAAFAEGVMIFYIIFQRKIIAGITTAGLAGR